MRGLETRTRQHFNPRSPRGERHRRQAAFARTPDDFNPRSPRGERPGSARPAKLPTPISIHALLAESDTFARSRLRRRIYFNPRSPRGERRLGSDIDTVLYNFNPRSPRGERQQICIIYYQFRLNYNMQKLRNSTCFPTFT